MDPLTISGIFGIGGKLIDKLFPDPEQRAKAQLELMKMQQAGELDDVKVQLSAIIAEAQSSDPWTSRARPSFLYPAAVVYPDGRAGGAKTRRSGSVYRWF